MTRLTYEVAEGFLKGVLSSEDAALTQLEDAAHAREMPGPVQPGKPEHVDGRAASAEVSQRST